ncbi:hypothetical protein FJSC11DRAFT_0468 [Fischerella thermalis JSC-11]|jgi:hypothetical protein|uniref:Uncharacterized protein n=1 Tax=Fischerella thermalis JSC-11 TaxID=741277 RepID=G6FNM1_9CYAN|nr:hypothetical protein FJSC11DRAFT_0468 [Fischerella thermalis JSC-11]
MSKPKTNVDKCNDLKSKFQEANLYNNFGNVLVKMHVQGFRCHTNTVIENVRWTFKSFSNFRRR